MAQKIEALRGMEDILPGEIEKWQWLENEARIFFESRGFKEIRTPILEYTDLFSRSVGEASDIVHKEMFSFEDRGGRHVTMRPEMTASVARAVIEKNLLSQAKSLRFYYLGPMFRAARPQAGRKRQFHQIGIEIINGAGAEVDLECVSLLYEFLGHLGASDIKVRVNDLGEAQDQTELAKKLKDFFEKEKSGLCKDCQWRLEKNVLRIFDCKVEACQKVIEKFPWETLAPLSENFKKVAAELENHKILFEIKRRLVRGLDYYNGLVFEVVSSTLGAQDALAGGGRYDGLYAQLGGKPTPCTGFSVGIERLLAVLDKSPESAFKRNAQRKVYLSPLGAERGIVNLVRESAWRLRERGIRVEMTAGETSLSKHLKRANQFGVRYVLIIGPDELKKGIWIVKDMEEKSQSEVVSKELIAHLSGKFGV